MTEDFLLIRMAQQPNPSVHKVDYVKTGWGSVEKAPAHYEGHWLGEDYWGNFVDNFMPPDNIPEHLLEDGELSAEFLRTGPQDGYWVWRIDYKKHE